MNRLHAAIDVEQRADELFAIDPDLFVVERNRLVKELKAEKRAEDAKRVQALRRPTTAAALLNKAVRTRPELVEQLERAVASLRDAQAKAMEGTNASIRDAMREFASAVDALATAAGGDRDEIAAALRVSASDEHAWDDVRHGRLSKLPAPDATADMWSAGAEPVRRERRDPAEKRRREKARADALAAREKADRIADEVAALEERLAATVLRLNEAEREARAAERVVEEDDDE